MWEVNTEGMDYDALMSRFPTRVSTASKEVVAGLPVTKLKTADIAKLPEHKRDCCICLEEFDRSKGIKTLPCLHAFHSSCISKWLTKGGFFKIMVISLSI